MPIENTYAPPPAYNDGALLRAENRILQMIADGESRSAVLSEIARAAERLCGDGILCSVLLLDENAKRLLHGAAPSLPEDYNNAIHGIRIGPNIGSCGTAAFTGTQVIVSDIAKDPLWENFKELALAHGLRACWSTPILSPSNEVVGTFALYYNQASYPTKFANRVIDSLTRTAALAVQNCPEQANPGLRKAS